MQRVCFMGIDAGTSGIKAIVFDTTGAVRGMGYHECDVIMPQPGWAEQDAHMWWDACRSAAKEAAAKSGCGREIEGIGFSGQMQGCTLLDRNMEPIGNSIIWLDQRSSAEAEAIERELVPDSLAVSITANHSLNSFWAPKLLWVKRNRPADFERTSKVLFAKDYLRYRMTGEVAAEVSDASLSFLMDVPRRKWSMEMADRLGLPRELLPERLLESTDIAGYLLPEIAEEWGLRPGIPVVAGGGDQPAGGVGTGIVRPGVIGSTIGTSGVIFGCTAAPFVDEKSRAILSMAHAVPNKWCFLGLVLSAGASFKWLRDTFFSEKKAELAARAKIYTTI